MNKDRLKGLTSTKCHTDVYMSAANEIINTGLTSGTHW